MSMIMVFTFFISNFSIIIIIFHKIFYQGFMELLRHQISIIFLEHGTLLLTQKKKKTNK